MDIVKKLREQADEQEDERIIRAGREPWGIDRKAADEIERLRLELRGVIQSMAETGNALTIYAGNLDRAYPDA